MSVGYTVLPHVYDRWQQTYGKDFSAIILPRLLSAIKHYGIPTSTMLDLACGTGTLAILMARRGWRVWGIDGSAGMLTEAAKKMKHRNWPVTLLRATMQEFNIPERFALVTSFFDSINHLRTKRDLLRTFRAVCRHLQPGGYFVFDVNNERCFETLWKQTEVVRHEDFTLILKNRYDSEKRSARSDVTLFLRKGDCYREKTETVRERCFQDQEIAELLRKAGLRVLVSERFNFTSAVHLGDVKTWWITQRAG
jgi:ubiquinone/menaquinone biosynthesis C-methylase UbiE